MEIRNGDNLVISNSDRIGYFDTMKVLFIGSKVEVNGKKYKIIEFSKVELAFGGNRAFFKVKEI